MSRTSKDKKQAGIIPDRENYVNASNCESSQKDM
jgi:hypothetical protein